MSQENIITLNDSLITREDDLALFSLQKMQVYKFTKVGFEIIKYIDKNNVCVDEIKLYNKYYNMNEKETNIFIDKLFSADLIRTS